MTQLAQLTLNLGEGSVSFKSSPEAAKQLKEALDQIMTGLKAVASKTSALGAGATAKPIPQKPIEYRHVGEVFLEVFCNPNIWPTPFAAKVLITVRDDRIRVSTEAELSRIIEDVNQFLEQFA
jgi:hypothetical protein